MLVSILEPLQSITLLLLSPADLFPAENGPYKVRAKVGGVSASLNGEPLVGGGTADDWRDFGSVSTLTSITNGPASSGVYGGNIYAIEVNGAILIDQGLSDPNAVSVVSVDSANSQMVVDGGDWDASNQSQAWSTGGDNTNAAASRGWDQAFNGDTNTVASPLDNSSEMTWTGDIPVTSGQTVVFRMWRQSAWTGVFEVNGTDYSPSIPVTAISEAPSPGYTQEITLPIASNITSIKMTNTSASTSNKQLGIAYIKVGGRPLVDAVNDSQVWSQACTLELLPGSSIVSGTLADLFNNQDTDYLYVDNGNPGNGIVSKIILPSGTRASKVEVWSAYERRRCFRCQY